MSEPRWSNDPIDLSSPKRRTKKTGSSIDTETMTQVLNGIGAMFGI